jgi:hypothetical protein
MRTSWKVLAIALLAIFLASLDAKAILEVAHGNGADVSFVNDYGFAVTWIDACITGAVGTAAILVAILAGVIYRWRRKHGY